MTHAIRRHRHRLFALALIAGIACAHAPASPGEPFAATPAPLAVAAPEHQPAGELVATDTTCTTPSGIRFTIPAGFSVTTAPSQTILDFPEADHHIAIVDVQATDGESALAAAWAIYKPGFHAAVKTRLTPVHHDGWGERVYRIYDAPPDNKLDFEAEARRSGSSWTVVIVDSDWATTQAHEVAVDSLWLSIQPASYVPETFAGVKPHVLDAARVKLVRDYIDAAQAAYNVPGVALALVQDGKVIFAGGSGVRELGKPARVDADTLFLAGDETNLLTSLLYARLVDAGKLRWDSPVTDIYPEFKLGNADVTRQVLVKHLLCGCIALPQHVLPETFAVRHLSAKAVVAELATIQPTSKLGESYSYSNHLVTAAGFIAGHVVAPEREMGAAYDDAMRTMIFEPLGMKSATFGFEHALAGNHASGHGDDMDGHIIVTDDLSHSAVPYRPVAGAWLSAHDLTRYVQLELARGVLPDGKRFVSEANLLARRAPEIKSGIHVTSGMGLDTDMQYGIPVVSRLGDMMGYESDVVFLPGAGVGAVVLTNSLGGASLIQGFQRRLLEVLFDGRPEALADLAEAVHNRPADLADARKSMVIPADPIAVGQLAPRYRNPLLGELAVKHDGAAVIFDFGEWRSPVATRHNDDGTTSFVILAPGASGVHLDVSSREGQRSLTIHYGSEEYVFAEVN